MREGAEVTTAGDVWLIVCHADAFGLFATNVGYVMSSDFNGSSSCFCSAVNGERQKHNEMCVK